MTLPTVAEVLALDAVRRGQPRLLAGAGRLDAPVRWVHAIEHADAARLLRGNELVLTTGIALPDDPGLIEAYVTGLADVGISALAVELGRRFTGGLPGALVAAAAAHQLPLIVFEREVPFIGITEAVHARIIDAQLHQLRVSERLHEVFTDLAVAGAAPDEIIRQAALLAGRPVILADLAHHVLACEPAGADPARLLEEFAARSRAAVESDGARTRYDPPTGWLTTVVGARGEDWGRIIVACDGPPGPGDQVLIERAATTLALARLLTSQQQNLERQAHASLIGAILASPDGDPEQAALRARALGVPVAGRRLVAAVFRFRIGWSGLPSQALVLELAGAVADACHGARVPALVGSLDEARAAAVLSLDQRASPDHVLGELLDQARSRFGRRTRRLPGLVAGEPVIGVGSVAPSIRELRRSLLEAQQVADAVAGAPPGAATGHAGRSAGGTEPAGRPPIAELGSPEVAGWPYYRLADLRLRGLLHLLGDDPRLVTFVDRELGPLLRYDAAHGSDLTGLLAVYLAAGGNKAETATRAHLARPTLYDRLRQVERIIGADLGSAESLASLYVAVLARDGQANAARHGLSGCPVTESAAVSPPLRFPGACLARATRTARLRSWHGYSWSRPYQESHPHHM